MYVCNIYRTCMCEFHVCINNKSDFQIHGLKHGVCIIYILYVYMMFVGCMGWAQVPGHSFLGPGPRPIGTMELRSLACVWPNSMSWAMGIRNLIAIIIALLHLSSSSINGVTCCCINEAPEASSYRLNRGIGWIKKDVTYFHKQAHGGGMGVGGPRPGPGP